MSTEQAPNPTPTTTTITTQQDSTTTNPNPDTGTGDQAKPGDQPNTDNKAVDESLLFKPKDDKAKPDDKPADDKKVDEKPLTPDEQKKFLLDKKVDPKSLEGKTDEEIKKMFDEQSAKDKAEADAGPKVNFEEIKTSDGTKIAPENMDWLKKFAGDNKLTQEQAQELVDRGVEMQKQNLQFWNDTKKNWLGEVKADPEIGGKNLESTVNNVETAIQKFAANKEFGGSPELLAELQQDLVMLGLGVKKSFIKLMNNVHRATANDSMDGRSGSNPPKKDIAERMYPGMRSENQR